MKRRIRGEIEMSRIPLTDQETVEFMRILGHLPELQQKWVELDSTLMFSGTLSPKLKHRVQMALATHAGCRFCESMTEPPPDGYDRKEELAVAFAEMVQSDPQGINQGHFDVLSEEFTVEQVVELCMVVGFKLGGLALGEIWALQPGTPEVKAAYDGVVADAQQRWESHQGEAGNGSLWRRHLDQNAPSASALS
jgi:alkylhydroperoxidase family enzyme